MPIALPLLLTVLASSTPDLRIVAGSGLRVRAQADTRSKIVGRLPLGETLPCLERSGSAKVGKMSGAFCRTRLASGAEGFFYEPLTRAFDPDQAQKAYEAIARERKSALGYCDEARKSDVWGYQAFLRTRIAAASTPARKARWRLEELRLLQRQACLYLGGDQRVYRDESQGARLKREVIWKLVDRSLKTAPKVAEEAAYFAVAHGMDFECEGWGPCYLAWKKQIECAYLKRFPKGAHAEGAVEGVGRTAKDLLAEIEKGNLPAADLAGHDLTTVREVRACLEGSAARAAPAARASLDKTIQLLLRAGVKEEK